MHKWLVIVDYDAPISTAEAVDLQAALGDDQREIAHNEHGIVVVVRADRQPTVRPLPRDRVAAPRTLVARLPADTSLSGDLPLLDWWLAPPP